MTLNWAKLSFLSLHFSMETLKIELNPQEMELIALCIDMMSGERNLELLGSSTRASRLGSLS
jgi:hypothetical protein